MTTWHSSTLAYAFSKKGDPKHSGSQSICILGISNNRQDCESAIVSHFGTERYAKMQSEGYKIARVRITLDND